MSQSLLIIVALYFGQPVATMSFVDSDICMDTARAIVWVLNKTEGFTDAEGFCKPTDQRRV